MAVIVHLKDGVDFLVKASIGDFGEAIQLALDNNQVIAVRSDKGRTRFLNPRQIVFCEEAG